MIAIEQGDWTKRKEDKRKINTVSLRKRVKDYGELQTGLKNSFQHCKRVKGTK